MGAATEIVTLIKPQDGVNEWQQFAAFKLGKEKFGAGILNIPGSIITAGVAKIPNSLDFENTLPENFDDFVN